MFKKDQQWKHFAVVNISPAQGEVSFWSHVVKISLISTRDIKNLLDNTKSVLCWSTESLA